jgi:penicillin-binding protein 1A
MKGNVILDYDEKGVQAIGEDTAVVMNHMLQNVVYGGSGTGRGAGGYVSNMRIFAKTGTSNNTRDLWFVGGTPYYVASCWTGYDNNYTINSSSIAQRMWGAVMKDIHKGLEAKKFATSKYVSKRYYCADTGLLATTKCENKHIGYYKNSYLPICSHHGGTILPPISGSNATFSGKSGVVKGKVTGMLAKKQEEESSSEGSSSGENSSTNSNSSGGTLFPSH